METEEISVTDGELSNTAGEKEADGEDGLSMISANTPDQEGTAGTTQKEEPPVAVEESESFNHIPPFYNSYSISKNSAADVSSIPNSCKQCDRYFKSKKGLSIHSSRVHKSLPNDQRKSPKVPVSNNTYFNDKCHDTQDDPIHIRLSHFRNSDLRVIKRIPKSVRYPVAAALCDAIDDCVKLNSISSWESLLFFAYKTLSFSFTDGQQNSISSQILKNLKTPFNFNAFHSHKNIPHSKDSKDSTSSTGKRVISKVSDGDLTSAIKILCSNESFATFNDSVFKELELKHPKSIPSEVPSFSQCSSLSASTEDVLSAVKSFRTSSAGGIDALRPSHLQDLLSYSSGCLAKKLLCSLTSLCNLMLSGKVHPDICPIIYGASLCALKKKDGGIRPIAIGNIFRRLVAKISCKKIKESLGNLFRPIQFGFGTPGGCEVVSHSARIFLNSQASDSKKVFLKIDFKNAFNSIHRHVLLKIVIDRIPSLLPFFSQCYLLPSFLNYGKKVIISERGVQQGDPLGSPLFCLAIDSLTKSIDSEFNCWYLDDGCIGGNVSSVFHNFEKIINISDTLGLELNFTKCELLFFSTPSPCSTSMFGSINDSISIPDKRDWNLLGAPLTSEALESCFQQKIDDLSLISSRLREYKIPSHISYFLLKNCLAIPKLTYLLRCSPSWRCNGLRDFDKLLRASLVEILNIQISDQCWQQASLPLSRGGLGIRQSVSLSLPAFLSSFNKSLHFVKAILKTSSDIFDSTYLEGEDLWLTSSKYVKIDHNKSIQKCWDSPLLDIVSEKLLESAITPTSKARLLAVSSEYSSAWLSALPVSSLGTLLDDQSFRIAVGLRLGAPLCAPHTCICSSSVDESGIHGLSCRFSAGRHSRHKVVNDLIRRALVSAQIPSTLEPNHIFRDDGKRPDGITLIPWKSGKSVIWDFTCNDTLATSHVVACSKQAGAAAAYGEDIKIKKYSNLSDFYIFHPVGIETFGVFGHYAINFIKEIGKRISQISFDPRSTSFLIQKISIAIQRGNAASVLGTIPSTTSFDELLFIPSGDSNIRSSFPIPRFCKSQNSFFEDNRPNPHSTSSAHSEISNNFVNSHSNLSPSSLNRISFSHNTNKKREESEGPLTSYKNYLNNNTPPVHFHKNSRLQEDEPNLTTHEVTPEGYTRNCPAIPGAVAPWDVSTVEDVQAVCGKYRGIQGYHNSCYLDVTLFSMFTYTSVFDSILVRPKKMCDIDDYEEVQRVLREEIVNPLRKNLFVSSGNVMKLRRYLHKLSNIPGFTSEEKDPEEFLNSLLSQILKAEPFLKLNTGHETFLHQLFVEKDAHMNMPTVQHLFEQSFLTSNIKLKHVPPCLILQMPRFGKNYKMYPRILQSQFLDVTDVIDRYSRTRTGSGDTSPAQEMYRVPRLFMELFAVICIETSHYVVFAKCGVGHEAPWCFFDSMADRSGEEIGLNIPEMVACPDISCFLSDEAKCKQLHEECPADRQLPELARRFYCDAYICMYQGI